MLVASRNRIVVVTAMLMSVALIATVVQQSDSGLAREDVASPVWDSKPLQLMPKLEAVEALSEPSFEEVSDPEDEELAQWSIDKHLHKKQAKLKAIEENARPAAVIKNLVELRAMCQLIAHTAQDMIGKSSGNTALPTFIREFGRREPKVKKPYPQVVDGIEQKMKWVPPSFNIVTFYAKAMAKTKRKFSAKKGLNKYVLDNLDAFIVAGHPVIVALDNVHFGVKKRDRRGINKRAIGMTLNPGYLMKLTAPVGHWQDLKEAQWKKARHADVAAAAHMLKAGAKSTYVSFLDRAKAKEAKRLLAGHQKEVAIAKAALQKKYALDSDKRTFHNVKMLPGAALKALDEADTAVKPRSMNEVRKEARDAAAKWVEDKKASTKNLVVANIKAAELHERAKSCQMRAGDRYCFKPNTRIYSTEPCCVKGLENTKAPCCA